MKKIFAMILALAMALSLAACGGKTAPETTAAPQAVETEAPAQQTEAPAETQAPEAEETEAPVAASDDPYCITLEGVILVPGEAYDPDALPAPDSVYQVPSCAIEGTDNVYSFPTFEVTAFDDGSGEVIYSVVIIDPNVATDEGLLLGDKVERVIELYGENYEESGTAMVYTGGDTMLRIIVQNGYVADIEYRWVTE